MRSETWRDEAACRRTDPSTYFLPSGQIPKSVFETCAKCRVRVECLNYALDLRLDHGVFGGLTGRQRVALRKRN